jgi:hypothetical protein
MDEGFCRGFISMALGNVNAVEDLSSAIRFKEDVAEVLVTLAGSQKLTHAYLASNVAFQKICFKLGFESTRMSAILSLISNDIDSVDEIVDDLYDVKLLPPEFLRAFMAISYFNDSDDDATTQPRNYDPFVKKGLIEGSIAPLSRLYDVSDPEIATFLICLA